MNTHWGERGKERSWQHYRYWLLLVLLFPASLSIHRSFNAHSQAAAARSLRLTSPSGAEWLHKEPLGSTSQLSSSPSPWGNSAKEPLHTIRQSLRDPAADYMRLYQRSEWDKLPADGPSQILVMGYKGGRVHGV